MNFRDVAKTTYEASHASQFSGIFALEKISIKRDAKVTDNKAIQKLERVYFDVFRQVSASSIEGNRKKFISTDEIRGYASLQTFKEYVAQSDRPKNFRTYYGTKYKNRAFKKIRMSKTIAREFTVSEKPEKNVVAERFNRKVLQAAKCLLIFSKLPK